jgi:hypothetical protein
VTAALRLLPPSPCIMVMYSAEVIISSVTRYPALLSDPVVHDLRALQRWEGCNGESKKDSCIAAVQMLLLGDCAAMIGSVKR